VVKPPKSRMSFPKNALSRSNTCRAARRVTQRTYAGPDQRIMCTTSCSLGCHSTSLRRVLLRPMPYPPHPCKGPAAESGWLPSIFPMAVLVRFMVHSDRFTRQPGTVGHIGKKKMAGLTSKSSTSFSALGMVTMAAPASQGRCSLERKASWLSLAESLSEVDKPSLTGPRDSCTKAGELSRPRQLGLPT
jgi:hypothetical protein